MNLLSTCLAMGAPSSQPAGTEQPFWVTLFPFILIFVIMYFMLIRPHQKKLKETEDLVKAAKTGDQVVAAGGIIGMISNVKDKTVILKVADNVKIEVLKSSIVSVTKAGSESTPAS